MPKFIDLNGQTFGEWTAIEYLGNSRWLCKDTKGNRKSIHSYELRTKYKDGYKVKGIMPDGFMHNRFGNWYVEEYIGAGFWKCRCSCGRISNVNSYDLKNMKSTQCNECSKKAKLKYDLTGKTFGLWEVKYYAGNMRWHCECNCDRHTEKDVLTKHLISGVSKSCGCTTNKHIIHKDITGKTFGYLKVIEYTGKDQMWKCECLNCGNRNFIAFRDSIVSGKTKSCGCLKETLRTTSLMQKYGDTNTTRINVPRREWQIKAISSKENLEEYIKSLGYKPTAFELSQMLDVHDTTMLKALRKFDLMNTIKDVDSGTSAMELELLDYINKFGYNVITRDKSILAGKELDIYIPEKKLAVEFNGDYWHSSIFKDANYHQQKTIECIKHSIHLIHIFEYEWLDADKKEKILNYLNHLLGDNRKIYARNTDIKIIDRAYSYEFCNKYHLQGGINSADISIGCYNNEELLGVMIFGYPRFGNDVEYELLRLCWKSDVQVVGGSEKLFKHFINKYNPSSIVSYCDLTKFDGSIYFKLGFSTSKNDITKPNYVWVNKSLNDTLTRYQTQKAKLVKLGLGDESDTEDDIMTNNGYLKIYNSGNVKFLWKTA